MNPIKLLYNIQVTIAMVDAHINTGSPLRKTKPSNIVQNCINRVGMSVRDDDKDTEVSLFFSSTAEDATVFIAVIKDNWNFGTHCIDDFGNKIPLLILSENCFKCSISDSYTVLYKCVKHIMKDYTDSIVPCIMCSRHIKDTDVPIKDIVISLYMVFVLDSLSKIYSGEISSKISSYTLEYIKNNYDDPSYTIDLFTKAFNGITVNDPCNIVVELIIDNLFGMSN